ncbi:Exosome complex component RRP45 [Rhizophlyctis rosea]|uniref:Exosome complex component RRP45 n=1 Tax=Rhizophlyctis rosea TaxID=64517 RepID=A0AAD5SRW4_9FUNG|nr:Exosome complex component RRP45 [Rhizophlyctis rosea]
MVRETEPIANNERAFVKNVILEGLRVDNRSAHDVRTVKINFGSQWGHSEVQLGKTRVAATVSCEMVRPSPAQPTEGIIQFSTEFSPMASPSIESGRLSEEEVLISRLLEKALKRSRAIDTEGLCIVAGEKVWAVRVDIRVLDHNGNVLDCACIAAVAALQHFRRPDVTVVGEEVTIHSLDERSPIPLSIFHIPICVTFAFFSNGERQVVDPSLLEEQIQEGDMTFVINIHRELCTLSKAGGIPIEGSQILHCANIAAIKAAEITELIKAANMESQTRKEKKKESKRE